LETSSKMSRNPPATFHYRRGRKKQHLDRREKRSQTQNVKEEIKYRVPLAMQRVFLKHRRGGTGGGLNREQLS